MLTNPLFWCEHDIFHSKVIVDVDHLIDDSNFGVKPPEDLAADIS